MELKFVLMELDLKYERLSREELDIVVNELHEVELEYQLRESRIRGLMLSNRMLNERIVELVEENNKLKEAAMESELEEEEELEGEELEAYWTVCDALDLAMGGRHVTKKSGSVIACRSMLCIYDV